MEPLEFVSEMQHAALEINDHQVISRAMKQSFGNFIFMAFCRRSRSTIWSGFVTIVPESMREIIRKKKRRSTAEWRNLLGKIPQTLLEGVRSSCDSKKLKLLTQQASPMLVKSKTENS
jgi:hypothetical protein